MNSVGSVGRGPDDLLADARHQEHRGGRSLYAFLLSEVLDHPLEWRNLSRPPDPLAELDRVRRSLEEHLFRSDPGWALQAIADQLAYDSALIRLARREGLHPVPATFDLPSRGRMRVAASLMGRGIHLTMAPTTAANGAGDFNGIIDDHRDEQPSGDAT